MRHLSSLLAVISFLSTTVVAHGVFRAMWINGMDYGDYCARRTRNINWSNPPMKYNDPNLSCREDLVIKRPNVVCEVKPGDMITVEHSFFVDRELSGTCQAINNAAFLDRHWGPVMTYLAPVEKAITAKGAEASWFKVFEAGLLSNNPPYWAVNLYQLNCGHITFKVPDVAPGQYLLRAEIIALHYALEPEPYGGAQFYSGCFQLQINGEGTGRPNTTVKFPGAYLPADPGLKYDIWAPSLPEYTIPGPRPYGYTAAPMLTTRYPATTATWPTWMQPTTIPLGPNGYVVPFEPKTP